MIDHRQYGVQVHDGTCCGQLNRNDLARQPAHEQVAGELLNCRRARAVADPDEKAALSDDEQVAPFPS